MVSSPHTKGQNRHNISSPKTVALVRLPLHPVGAEVFLRVVFVPLPYCRQLLWGNLELIAGTNLLLHAATSNPRRGVGLSMCHCYKPLSPRPYVLMLHPISFLPHPLPHRGKVIDWVSWGQIEAQPCLTRGLSQTWLSKRPGWWEDAQLSLDSAKAAVSTKRVRLRAQS